MPFFSKSEATTNAKRKHKANKHTKQKMSNPRGFMEPIYEQNEDAGYDFSEEAFASDNAYYAKYGGNSCLVCAGGSYINPTYVKHADVKPSVKPVSHYDDDDYYEEEDYEDDTNDY